MQDAKSLYLTVGSGNNFKPMLVAAQLGIELDCHYIDVLAGESRQPEFLSINPLGVVPYLVLKDGTGIGESNAISWYLAEGSKLIPDTALGRAQAIAWMNFEQTSLEPNISPVRFFTFVAPQLEADNKDMIPVWREKGCHGLGVLDTHLAKNDFVTPYGYSVADIAVFGYTHLADEGGFDFADYPNVTAWIQRVQNQPGYISVYELLDGQQGKTRAKAA